MRFQRRVLLALVFLVPLLVWRGGHDPVELPKAVLLLAGLVVIGGVSAARAVVLRRITLPDGWVPRAVYGFVAAVIVSGVAAGAPLLTLAGPYRRYTGVVMYVAYALLFLAVIRVADERHVVRIGAAALGSSSLVGLYALVQQAGADPLGWGITYGGAFSTLGNPNFASAFLGMGVPLAAWGALTRRWRPVTRVAAGAAGALAIVGIFATGSEQGLVAAAAGVAAMGLAWVWSNRARAGRVVVAASGIAVVAALATAASGLLAARGPLASLGTGASLEARTWYWTAALQMFAEHPVAGVGLGRYERFYRVFRPPEALEGIGWTSTMDSAHSVPLDLLAGGGLLVGLAYAAVVVAVAVTAIRGLRRLEGERLLLLGGLSGAWLAYHVQAAVSLDVPPLAFMHWLLAGAIVVVVEPASLRVWEPKEGQARNRGGTKASWGPRDAALAVVTLATLGLLAVTLTPLRANAAAQDAEGLAAAGAWDPAAAAWGRAATLAPWAAEYRMRQGEALLEAGRGRLALEVFESIARRDPRHFEAVMTSARIAVALGDTERADRWYERALQLEPQAPQLKAEIAASGSGGT